jgi:hypothetical protein
VLALIYAPLGAIAWLAATGVALAIAYWVVRRRGSRVRAGRVRWWAELAGGIALVALALVALELSAVAGRGRAERALADRQSVAAERLLEAGEQAALHDLATSAELAALDARAASANQEPGATDEFERIDHARDLVAEHGDAVAERSGGALDPGLVPNETCPDGARPTRPGYEALLAAAWTDAGTAPGHLAASREDGFACDVLAGLSRAEADVWSARAAVLTVALVAIGLGAFLLALAADPARTAGPARWLLSLGIAGVAAGALAALFVFVHGLGGEIGLRPSARVEFAADVAAAETALARGECSTAVDHLDRALDAHDGFAPAYAARAEARLCSEDGTWLVASSMGEARVEAALADQTRAADLREPGAAELADMAWMRLVLAIEDPGTDETALREAAAGTGDAAQATSEVESPGVHVARFNHALARVALGENAEPEYRYALRCLDPAASCPGGGIEDDQLVVLYRLMALDDLELLAERIPETDLDRYRALITSENAVAVAPAPGPAWTLAVYPQELWVETEDAPESDVAIAWYYRADPGQRWNVILQPSWATVVPGDHAYDFLPTYHALPAGEYRADVYADGRLSRAVAPWDGPAGHERVVVPDLGFSAVVPPGWSVTPGEHGVQAAVGPDAAPEALVVRRTEGVWPDAEGDVDGWLDDTLTEWVASEVGTDMVANGVDVTEEQPWYLGLDNIHVHDYPDAGVWAATGILPYAIDPYCGGTQFMTLVRTDDPDALTVLHSLMLDFGTTQTLQPLTGSVETDAWAVDLPLDWVGTDLALVGAHDRFAAQDCRSRAGLSIESEELTAGGSLVDVASARVDARLADGDLTRVRDDVERRLPFGDPAVDVALATTVDGVEIEHRLVYVSDGTTLTTLAFTVPGDGDFDDDIDRAIDSFRLTAG